MAEPDPNRIYSANLHHGDLRFEVRVLDLDTGKRLGWFLITKQGEVPLATEEARLLLGVLKMGV